MANLLNPLQTLIHYATAHLNYIVRVEVLEVPKYSSPVKEVAGMSAQAAATTNMAA